MHWKFSAAGLAGFLLIAGISSPPAQAATAPCDRACLAGFVDQYLAALVAHDPARAPLARKVKFTENGPALEVGDGLWGTASGLGAYKLYIADPKGGAAGFIGVVEEYGRPVILTLRLKVKKQRIREIETLVMRDTFAPLGLDPAAGPGAPLEQQGKPNPVFLESLAPTERLPRHDMIAIVNAYFSALQRGNTSIQVPFDDSCNRQENGVQVTNNPKLGDPKAPFRIFALSCAAQFESGFFSFVTEIRDRRFVAVDEERGLVFAFTYFDHSGAEKTVTLADGRTLPSLALEPITFQIAEMFKIENGKIRRIEAVLNDRVPYRMKSAWDE